jgi:hypothetical protein
MPGEEFSVPLGLRSNAPEAVAISRAFCPKARRTPERAPARLGPAPQIESRHRSQPGGGFFAKMLLSRGPQRSTRAESPVSPEISPKEICQTVFG